jgi:hypothetical protein
MIVDKTRSVSISDEVFCEVLPHLRPPLLPPLVRAGANDGGVDSVLDHKSISFLPGESAGWILPRLMLCDRKHRLATAVRAMLTLARRESMILFINVYYVHT